MKKTKLQSYSNSELKQELRNREIYDPLVNELFNTITEIVNNYNMGLVDSYDTYNLLSECIKLVETKLQNN